MCTSHFCILCLIISLHFPLAFLPSFLIDCTFIQKSLEYVTFSSGDGEEHCCNHRGENSHSLFTVKFQVLCRRTRKNGADKLGVLRHTGIQVQKEPSGSFSSLQLQLIFIPERSMPHPYVQTGTFPKLIKNLFKY